jgi:outer membrane usher protein
MQREGHLEYEIAAGRTNNQGYDGRQRNPLFVLGSLMYGLPHDVTLYGGSLGSDNYQSLALGTGVSLGVVGSMSVDATVARTTPAGLTDTFTGESFRVRYSKSMMTTGSAVDLTAWRYSTSGFYTFSESNDPSSPQTWVMDDVRTGTLSARRRKRSSWQVSLSQTLGAVGSIGLTGSRDDYWGSPEVTNRLMATYSTGLGPVSLGLSYSIDHTLHSQGGQRENRQVALNVSVPLRAFGGPAAVRNTNLNYSGLQDQDGRTTNSLGMSGSLDEQGRWGYSANQGWGNQGQQTYSALALSYQGGMAGMSMNYNRSDVSEGINGMLNGGLLVTPYGVALSRYMGDTVALVRTAGASGVALQNSSGVTTNAWGYAVMPYLQNYRDNAVNLDPSNMPDDVVVTQTSRKVTPTRGAVVLADYRVRSGRQMLMTLTRQNGKPVPFGAVAYLAGEKGQEDASGIVGDGGQVYLTGVPEEGAVDVSWGKSADKQCQVHYHLPEKNGPVAEVEAACR